MTQGYGQQSGPTGPYGQQGVGQPQQWTQQPASGGGSAGAGGQQQGPSSGYPGAAGYAPGTASNPSSLTTLTKWLLGLAVAVVVLRLLQYIVGLVVGLTVVSTASAGMDAVGVAALGGGLLALLMLLANGVLSLGLLVVAIIVAVKASGKGRLGALIIPVTIVLSVVAYWVIQIILGVATHGVYDSSVVGMWSIIALIADSIRWLVVSAALIGGALMAHRWAKNG